MIFLIDLSISGLMLAEIVGGIFALVVAIIYGFRFYLKKSKENLLRNPSYEQNFLSKKHPSVDVFKYSRSFFKIGLVCSLGIVAMAFQMTTYENESVELAENGETIELDDNISVVRTPRYKKSKPIPIPTFTKKITTRIEIVEEPTLEPVFVPYEIEPVLVPEGVKITAPKRPKKPKPIVAAPDEQEPEVEPILLVVEQMPLFSKNCLNEDDKNLCSSTKLLSFVNSRIKYPSIAKENGITGTVVIQFVIEKDGSISDPKIVKDIGGGCGFEALRVVKLMDQWLPGRQRNRLVRVRFNLPVKFKLK